MAVWICSVGFLLVIAASVILPVFEKMPEFQTGQSTNKSAIYKGGNCTQIFILRRPR